MLSFILTEWGRTRKNVFLFAHEVGEPLGQFVNDRKTSVNAKFCRLLSHPRQFRGVGKSTFPVTFGMIPFGSYLQLQYLWFLTHPCVTVGPPLCPSRVPLGTTPCSFVTHATIVAYTRFRALAFPDTPSWKFSATLCNSDLLLLLFR